MSEMSLKQAKEIAQRLELAELSLNSILSNVDKSTTLYEKTLKEQKILLASIPKMDNKLNNMKILVGINFGFVVGLIVAKYFL